MAKSIIIIGAGMGGLAAGCYGQMNGYDTRIFELHTLPGGQCTAWKRMGFTFDACIHHLFGCHPSSKIYSLWNDLGAMPREMVRPDDCTSVLSPDGRLLIDFYDLEALEENMTRLSPADAAVIKDYVRAIKAFIGTDTMGEMVMGSSWSLAGAMLSKPSLIKWLKPTMRQFADRFSDPFLKKAFSLLVYSTPDIPMFIHLTRHAYGLSGGIQWPVGGALEFARSIESRYRELGGAVEYRSRVEKILVENDRAVGVRLVNGTEHRADFVISDADGRKTIMDMLEGRYADDRIRAICAEPDDETIMAVNVFLGVDRDLSKEPSAMIMLLPEPVVIAGHRCESLEMQLYGFDKTLAPEGKGVIKVELVSGYADWKRLSADKAAYDEAKKKAADQVIGLLGKRFPGIAAQVEAVDVSTLVTWERFMGGSHGWFNMPRKKDSFLSVMLGKGAEKTLPGLSGFYFAGIWSTNTGALFSNAASGKNAIRMICREDGRKFRTRAPAA
jgi:phytoene dehydrogenase-like protein